MTLNRGPVGADRTSSAWISWTTQIGALALVLSACMPMPTRVRNKDAADETGGSSGEGGDGGDGGNGGSSGTGGKGGAAGKADASIPVPVDARSDTAASPDTSAKLDVKLDGKKDTNMAAAVLWEKMNLVLANCIFCHNDPAKRLDLQETGLYDRLVNKEAERVPTGCLNKVLVVPNDPMASLLYQKLAGTMPAGCGERMPYKKPAVEPIELKMVADWINAGAPPK